MTSPEVKAMRRFTTLALTLVVLSSGAAYAANETNDWAAGEPSTIARVAPSDLKAALNRLEFSEKAIDHVMLRMEQFSTGYVRGVQVNAPALRNKSLEDVIEMKLVPGLSHTTPELNYNRETGKSEVHVAEPIWARMDSDTQNLVRRTAIAAVEELLSEGSALGSHEGGN